MIAAVHLLIDRPPWWAVAIAIANIWTANLIGSAQWDAVILGAVAVGYYAVLARRPWLLGAMLALVGTKPTNAWLPVGIVLLAALVRFWRLSDWIKAAVIPLVCLAASFAISGLNWPVRYVWYVTNYPPDAGYNLSFFKDPTNRLEGMLEIATVFFSFGALALHIRRRGFDGLAVALGFVVNLIASGYVTIYHYVAAIPAAVALGKRDSLWLVLLYIASIVWVVIQEPMLPLYPLILAGAAFAVQVRDWALTRGEVIA
jgi:hypothetical protein